MTHDPASLETSVDGEGVLGAMISDGAYTLFVADYDDPDSARAAYDVLRSAEDGVSVKIEGVLVVKRDQDGKVSVVKVTDKSAKKGLKWGLIGGAVIGLIFPPSILGGAAVAGAIGAATGKARELHRRGKLADELETAIQPGHSGIIVLVSNPGIVRVRAALTAANMIVSSTIDDVVAREIKAAAKAAKKESTEA